MGSVEAIQSLPPLVMRALAAGLDYLKPLGVEAVLRLGATFQPFSNAMHLALSANALSQLEVFRNSDDGSEKGSLLWLLDHTHTPFGGRLLRSWVGHPLLQAHDITERLDAVQCLLECSRGTSTDAGAAVLGMLPKLLIKLPDLERGITRILHCTAAPSEFVQVMKALVSVREGLVAQVLSFMLQLPRAGSPICSSTLLCSSIADATAQAVHDAAQYILNDISEQAAMLNDKLTLFASKERFPEVHRCIDNVAAAEEALKNLLPVLAKRIGLFALQYISIQNQGDYLIEVDVQRSSCVPKDWERICSTKKVHRYRPPQVQKALTELEVAKEHLGIACKEAWTQLLASFAVHYVTFRRAVKALAQLDALLSLSTVAGSEGYARPVIRPGSAPHALHVRGGRHPVLDALHPGAVVPNDIDLQTDGRTAMIVTGPNMGGKSSYIRMAALMAIMAQLGSFVPADQAEVSVFTAIFTRMGASDNLQLGRSTFLEELTEASTILNAADEKSLDELGRGTSTHDGLAIAMATLYTLVHRHKCLTLFVTHYPQVGELAHQFPASLSCHHMSYLEVGAPSLQAQAGHIGQASPNANVENVNQVNRPTVVCQPEEANSAKAAIMMESPKAAPAIPVITLLYKLAPGIAPRSFGLNVARLAKLPESVVQRAAGVSHRLERSSWQDSSAEVLAAGVAAAVQSAQQGQDVQAAVLQLVRLQGAVDALPSLVT